MNSHNILLFWGNKLKLKLDSSEFYDFQLGNNEIDFDTAVLDLTTPIIYTKLVIDSSCLVDFITPWRVVINENITTDNCDFTIRPRTERGWTLDFVFNRGNLTWNKGKTFYYLGVEDENDPRTYVDNNLSFKFTEDGRIWWGKIQFSGYCMTDAGYTEIFYLATGQTEPLCVSGTTEDFNITIVFERNLTLIDCDLVNEGGVNDLITSITAENVLEYITGGTLSIEIINDLNIKWTNERSKRLGTLKIYHNGSMIYHKKDWEEIIPHKIINTNILVAIIGGGMMNSGGIHIGDTEFELKRFKYFEEPLSSPRVKHHYLVNNKTIYTISECNTPCVDQINAL